MSTTNEADQQPTLLSAYDHDLQQLQQHFGDFLPAADNEKS